MLETLKSLYTPPAILWQALLPVIIVMCTGILALIVEMARPKKLHSVVIAISLAGLAVAGASAFLNITAAPSETFARMVVLDRFGSVMQLLLIIAAFLTVLFSEGYMREKRIPFGEFYPLALWSTAGGMMMVSTNNMLMFFIGLEVLSIALYVLAGLSRSEAKSEESALKYFLLGAFASAFLLYGIALIYGATGTLHFSGIEQAWAADQPAMRNLLIMGMGMALVGFSFKAGFVPFHQWTPDVYQGAPTNVTAFMAVASKIAAVAALYRFLEAALPMQALWMPVLTVIAAVTMLVGNLVALVQKDVKRILGYSSVAHAGYILTAILAHFKNPEAVGFGTLAYYLMGYGFMTIGAFAIVGIAAKSGREGTRLQDLNGLWRRNPTAAILLVIFMTSLIGVPPTAGFFGKLQIFRDAVQAEMLPLAITLAIASAISVYYYLGIALAAFVAEPSEESGAVRMNPGTVSATALCAAGVFLVAIFFAPITQALVGDTAGTAGDPISVQSSTPPVAMEVR